VLRSGRMGLTRLLVGGCAIVFACSTAGVCAAPAAAAKTCLQSLRSPHRVATEVQIPLQQSLSQDALGSPPKPPIVRSAKRVRAGL